MRKSSIGGRIHPEDLSIGPDLFRIGRRHLAIFGEDRWDVFIIGPSLSVGGALFDPLQILINAFRLIEGLKGLISTKRGAFRAERVFKGFSGGG